MCAVFSTQSRLHKTRQTPASSLAHSLWSCSGPVPINLLLVCLPAEFQLTMWMKSTGVAVYRSQCSLSRMILSMRRISAVEKLQPLCTTRSLTEPMTCSNTDEREANKRLVWKSMEVGDSFFCLTLRGRRTSSSSLILAASTSEVKVIHFRYFGWALKNKNRKDIVGRKQELTFHLSIIINLGAFDGV